MSDDHAIAATASDETLLPIRGPQAQVHERIVAARSALSALGSVLAIVPHLLHHLGILAGAAFITGAGGSGGSSDSPAPTNTPAGHDG